MSFEDELQRFASSVERRAEKAFIESVHLARESIVDGSFLTGSPGQPDATGELKGSWREVIGADGAVVSTRHPGAPTIEHGIRHGQRLELHAGGGFHSVALTRAAWQRIVDEGARKAAGQ